ncbi:MAG TPA: ferredoxin--NADP reductase [Kineosporiaceae bacterium]
MSWHVEVAEVIEETHEARTLVLRVPTRFVPDFAYRPGQFLTVRVPHPQSGPEGSVARCYSLSSSPDTDELPRITVKRVPGGYASNWLCDHITPGCTLQVLPPAGRFTPRRVDDDLLLVAGGSGITPVVSILKTALARGRARVSLLYANRDEDGVIFAQELKALQARHPDRLRVVLWLDSVQGPPTAAALQASIADLVPAGVGLAGPEVFLCGPGAFMDSAAHAVHGLGVPAARVHVERFESLAENPFATRPGTSGDLGEQEGSMDDASTGPAPRPGPAPAADAGPGGAPDTTVAVTRNGRVHTVPWPPGERLLDVLIAAGLNPPYSCRQGQCGACACRITGGEVELLHNEILEEEDLADQYILACQAVARTSIVEISYD